MNSQRWKKEQCYSSDEEKDDEDGGSGGGDAMGRNIKLIEKKEARSRSSSTSRNKFKSELLAESLMTSKFG